MDTKNGLQKSIDQIGEFNTLRYLPKGMKICNCDVHGSYLAHYKTENPTCPLCPLQDPSANGTNATEMEHYIDIKDVVQGICPKDSTSGDGLHS